MAFDTADIGLLQECLKHGIDQGRVIGGAVGQRLRHRRVRLDSGTGTFGHCTLTRL